MYKQLLYWTKCGGLGLLIALLLTSGMGTTLAQTPAVAAYPVTLPNNVSAPAGQEKYAAEGNTWFENNIWISIPDDGVIEIGPDQQIVDEDSEFAGWGSEKLIVLRGEGVDGFVVITGQRLDEKSDDVPTSDTTVDSSYGRSGFVPVALLIPSEGCWEFTATAGDNSATWVMDVRFAAIEATPAP